MNHLSIDTSDRFGSICLIADSRQDFRPLPQDQKTAQSLLPEIKRLFSDSGLDFQDIDQFSVASGPGSFTGIRIGMTAAKTLAWAAGKAVCPVNSLFAYACLAKNKGTWTEGTIHLVINAYRSQFFYAAFDFDKLEDQFAEADRRTRLIDQDLLKEKLDAEGGVVGGPGIEFASPAIQDQIGEFNRVDLPTSAAQGVGLAALLLEAKGAFIDPLELLPNYFRKSAAEEKLSK